MTFSGSGKRLPPHHPTVQTTVAERDKPAREWNNERKLGAPDHCGSVAYVDG